MMAVGRVFRYLIAQTLTGRMDTFFWEFFGPDAESTAAHFERHLLEFMGRTGSSPRESGVITGPGQALVFATVSESDADGVRASLRPAHHERGPLPAELRAAQSSSR